jgi:hypothetical protein
MEDFHREGISHEAKFFLLRAKLNPYFLFQHVKSLCGIILDKYSSKYFAKFRGRHLGSKSKPAWLRKIKIAAQGSDGGDLSRIPHLNFPVTRNKKDAATLYPANTDHENYLAQYRWSELIDARWSGLTLESLPASVIQFLEHPLPKLDAAWETYSTCERIANSLHWIAALPLSERAEKVPSAYLTFLKDSLHWVAKHLEYYRHKTGNHILNNARALIMAGVVLNNQHAVSTGLQIFKRMLPLLIQNDGALRERSSHYQLIVFTWLLDAYTFLSAAGHTDLAFLQNTLTKMRDTASLFCDEAGFLQVFIGDISPDLSPEKTALRLLSCYPQWWPAPLNENGKIIRDDWRLLQNEKSKIILNCPSGRYPKRFPSHAHNDISSFVWIYNGEPILIDCGRARYTKDEISTRQKSARGHNLPLVNGFAPLCESLVVSGNWWPVPYAHADVHIEEPESGVVITHDGYKRATPVKKHKRLITSERKLTRVRDHFSGKGKVKIDILWQLNPNARYRKNNLTINGTEIEIDLSNTPVPPQIHYLEAASQSSWYSTEYGCADAHPIMIMSWDVMLPFTAEILFKVKSCAV